MTTTPPVVLTIAGSDSCAGAGVQADLKTFAAHGAYGTCAIAALTAQNTQGVQRTQPVDPSMVAAQIAAVAEDLPVAAVKTGMLGAAGVVEAVVESVTRFALPRLVVDPIVRSSSGADLLDAAGVDVLRMRLLPLAALVTPNWVEAEALTGVRIASTGDACLAARALLDLGAGAVLVTGGHGPGDDIVDVLVTRDGVSEFRTARVAGRATHGTGCAFSAALAAHLAHGRPLDDAIPLAQAYVADAIRNGFDLGFGPHGPMNHFPDDPTEPGDN
jgi:hydroxymethylpyrimidine/phosphomethylpyrimidine kinase